jgi:ornithine carbamoyltransferase
VRAPFYSPFILKILCILLHKKGDLEMAFNLRNRNFLKELDFTPEELKFLLRLSADLKAAKYGGYEQQRLKGKNIALIFEKDSTRTRCAFEVAAYDQGAHVTYLGPEGSQIGHKESMKDTARVLGHMYDGIEYGGFPRRRWKSSGSTPGRRCGTA